MYSALVPVLSVRLDVQWQLLRARRSALPELFPSWDCSLVDSEIWWYNDGSGDLKRPLLEPAGAPASLSLQPSHLVVAAC
jgi:hypothetical protein